MKKAISVNLDTSVVNFLEQLSKVENRNKSNLLNEIVKNYYENLPLKQKISVLRIKDFIGEK
ncbi:ribbon-helix-helix domain-containing protein [Aliarcobacter cryaerophilus]|jgi:predicted DNA-binding protein|uniref:hypothetical protein n=1 Tax=Aliarcobacter cryaerophilus TaxID=28198 RepID=UPI0021B18B0F|nr:hypothetical protein [Aliarcobacter cryaerophilus]MCT7469229.1 hypothetical protein [Aliarcobacter cryaerophilus]